MKSPTADGYDDLLGHLKFLASHLDPVPARVKEAARACVIWQTIDDELAELVYDSVVDDQLVGIRGSGGSRQLTFRAPECTVEVEVAPLGGRMQGQIVPPRQLDIEVRHPGGTTTVHTDAHGHFSTPDVPAGPVSLRWGGAGLMGEGPIVTDWVVI
ncbi:MAG: hypothetical protein ABR511_07100 [Acidimicrobiales bacterium]